MNIPPYDTFPTLYTGRLFLRELTISDLNDIIEISYYGGKPAANAGEALEILKKINADYLNGTCINWGITANDDKVAGSVGYYRGFKDNTGEIGFVLKKDFEGKGFMTDAVKAVIDFGFNVIGLSRVIAITKHYNDKSKAVMERAGMKMTKPLENDYVEYEIMR